MNETEQAIQHGLQTGDWTGYLVVSGFILVAFVIRYVLKRLDETEKWQRETMAITIDDNSISFGHFAVLVKKIKCISDSDAVRFATRDMTDEEIQSLPDSAKRALDRVEAHRKRAEKVNK